MEPDHPHNQPESAKEVAARIGCIILIIALVFVAGLAGFIFTQGVRF